MTILAIETSSVECSVAISKNGTLAAIAETHVPNAHDAQLVALTNQCLQQVGLKVSDLDAVAVSAGPGSFTGLRIGVSFAKGLCFRLPIALYAVPTMWAIAAASQEVAVVANKTSVIAVIPSHRGLCYVQEFSVNETRIAELSPVRLLDIEHVRTMINADVLIAGPGARGIEPLSISGLSRLSARFVLRAIATQKESGPAWLADPLVLEPLYQQEFTGNQSSSPSSSSSSSSSTSSS